MTSIATTVGGLALVGLGVAAAVSYTTGANLAGAKTVAAPVLTSTPASSTNSTVATFAWTGPASPATFQCSLDNAAFTACTTPKTYSPVTVSAHSFQVRTISGTDQSTATAYSWTVDQTPPAAPTFVSKPSASSNTTNPTFTFGSEPGATFQCKLDSAATFAPCSNPQTFGGLAQGPHSLSVKAIDTAGNVSTTAASYGWTIDTVAPPAPTITVKPNDPAVGATQTFEFKDTEAGVTYQCAGENGTFAACTSPYSYIVDTTNNGQHQFAVRALDAALNVSSEASYKFKVVKDTSTSGTPFQITGSVSGLTIGVWKPVAVRVTNPNSNPIYVTTLNFSVSADSSPTTGCPSATNIETQQSNVSTTVKLVVPANGFVDLPAASQGITAPQMRLKDLPSTNQDVCKGKSFTLAFNGTANN